VVDTSNLGGKVGDLIVQHRDPSTKSYRMTTYLIETKADSKKKLTKSQEDNVLELTRIDCVQDVFDLLGMTSPDGRYAA